MHKPQRNTLYANAPCRKPEVISGASEDRDWHGVEICKLFQAGKCGFGDQCKFSHSGKPDDQLAIARPASMEEEEEEIRIPISWSAIMCQQEEVIDW